MKKMVLVAGGSALFLFLLLLMMIVGLFGGQNSAPIMDFADEKEAYAYQCIGTELGIPWDIVMLSDGIRAYSAGEDTLKNYNPMMTSLEFCIIQEEKFILTYEEEEDAEDTEQEKSEEGEEPKSSPAPKKETKKTPVWVSSGEIYTYTGAAEILNYLGKDKETAKISYTDASSLVAAIQTTAAKKEVKDKERYEAVLLANTDYAGVLRDYVGMEDNNIDAVMQLYEANYLACLYGYTYELPEVQLPDIVQGNVTRRQLAEMATSIIGHPYLMGGKSSEVGAPTGPLDCSGYVDWVYIQCFGVPVGSGSVPEGVAVSGTAMQFYASEQIKEKDLQIGDLGFVANPASIKNGQVNHVGIYLGTYNKNQYWVHCGGSSYGSEAAPKGRVGISVKSGYNSYDPITGNSFEPAMKSCIFKFFRRPRFEFADE